MVINVKSNNSDLFYFDDTIPSNICRHMDSKTILYNKRIMNNFKWKKNF